MSRGRIDANAFDRFWSDSEAADQLYRGRIAPEVFAAAAVAELSLDVKPAEFLTEFRGWLRGPYPGAFELLQALRPLATLACLSNTNELDVIQFRDRLSLHERFDRCFFSNEIGLRKPEAAVYQRVLDELAMPANEVAFFDDNAACVLGAKAVGMHGFHCVGVAALLAPLRELGFTLPD